LGHDFCKFLQSTKYSFALNPKIIPWLIPEFIPDRCFELFANPKDKINKTTKNKKKLYLTIFRIDSESIVPWLLSSK